MANFEIVFYETEKGKKPAREFLESLEPKMKAKTFSNLDILQDAGFSLREPYSKHLDDGIFELRSKVGSNISRVLYFFYVGNKIILTHGFVKKTRKTPPSEIEKAKKYRTDYRLRKDDNRE